MTDTVDDVLKEALRLPADDRVRIASELLASVAPDVETRDSEAWIAEVERRAQAAMDAVAGVSWSEARDQVEDRLRRK
jgi:putative addiction module component (TIGR02574 family)